MPPYWNDDWDKVAGSRRGAWVLADTHGQGFGPGGSGNDYNYDSFQNPLQDVPNATNYRGPLMEDWRPEMRALYGSAIDKYTMSLSNAARQENQRQEYMMNQGQAREGTGGSIAGNRMRERLASVQAANMLSAAGQGQAFAAQLKAQLAGLLNQASTSMEQSNLQRYQTDIDSYWRGAGLQEGSRQFGEQMGFQYEQLARESELYRDLLAQLNGGTGLGQNSSMPSGWM